MECNVDAAVEEVVPGTNIPLPIKVMEMPSAFIIGTHFFQQHLTDLFRLRRKVSDGRRFRGDGPHRAALVGCADVVYAAGQDVLHLEHVEHRLADVGVGGPLDASGHFRYDIQTAAYLVGNHLLTG